MKDLTSQLSTLQAKYDALETKATAASKKAAEAAKKAARDAKIAADIKRKYEELLAKDKNKPDKPAGEVKPKPDPIM